MGGAGLFTIALTACVTAIFNAVIQGATAVIALLGALAFGLRDVHTSREINEPKALHYPAALSRENLSKPRPSGRAGNNNLFAALLSAPYIELRTFCAHYLRRVMRARFGPSALCNASLIFLGAANDFSAVTKDCYLVGPRWAAVAEIIAGPQYLDTLPPVLRTAAVIHTESWMLSKIVGGVIGVAEFWVSIRSTEMAQRGEPFELVVGTVILASATLWAFHTLFAYQIHVAKEVNLNGAFSKLDAAILKSFPDRPLPDFRGDYYEMASDLNERLAPFNLLMRVHAGEKRPFPPAKSYPQVYSDMGESASLGGHSILLLLVALLVVFIIIGFMYRTPIFRVASPRLMDYLGFFGRAHFGF